MFQPIGVILRLIKFETYSELALLFVRILSRTTGLPALIKKRVSYIGRVPLLN